MRGMTRRRGLCLALIAVGLIASASVDGQPAAAASAPQASPAAPAMAAPATGPVSARNANYSIDVELDPAARTLTARGVVSWRNIAARPTSELQFHLYWNAWRNTESSFMREAGGVPSLPAALSPDDWGAIDVTAIRLVTGGGAPLADLRGSARFIAPDDGNPNDRTLLSLPLPQPIEPGQTITLEMAWTARVPRTFARTGAIGDFFFIAHWFPKIAVLGEDGWKAHQFHAMTEFFADFGVYDVRMTVPRGWVVGATGRERERREDGSRAVHRYVQEDVHDFAWTTSPDLVERTARFEHPRLPAVEMRLLLQPEHASQAERHFAATRAALKLYGEWFGPYPYGHITVVDPAWQSGAEGMEYPTLVTAGTRWLAPAGTEEPEDVTIHETGHQFWQGLVATNEFEHAWMDEGLTQYSTARVLHETYDDLAYSERFFGGFVPWVFQEAQLTRLTSGGLHGYRWGAETDAPAAPSWRLDPATGALLVYFKTALWLHTLEQYLGWPRLQRGLALYFERGRFAHPTPETLFSSLSQAAGRDLGWFFDQVHRSSNTFDYAVGEVTATSRGREGLGSDSRQYADGSARQPSWRSEVVVRRHGEAVFPIEVLVRFDDGSQVREQWDGRDRWTRLTYERPSQVVSVHVDPRHVLALDINRTNNSWTAEPQTREAGRQWAGRWWLWAQDLILTYGFFL
jgi:hypothetical protein